MFISYIENILQGDMLGRVQKLIAGASFVDGRISGGSEKSKKNLELTPGSESYIEVLKVVEGAVRENATFNFTAFPRYMTRPIISRYEAGMFYHEHVDQPVMNFMSSRGLSPLGSNYVRSDLSMTLFLTPPESYDGGELNFESSTGPLKTKLSAGSAVLYPTGVPHSVLQVTRGTRTAAIFWIQTMFPVEAERRLLCDANRLTNMLSKNPESPEFRLAQDNFFNLCRILAEV